ncbi:hypothetical protein [Oceanobacillus sp. CF4.6]|uniref:hypothetical protein n=1 Tax=Oceanobacillus sp. CF4.6 TaxID=3373080 RepID=UPI003EE4DC87
MKINTLEMSISEKEVIYSLGKMQSNISYSINNIVFYPYFFFEYSFARKNPISPLKGTVGCTIDGLSGVTALADKRPDFTTIDILKKELLPLELQEDNAQKIAIEFLFHTISRKIKVLSSPKLELKSSQLFYRSYWVVNGHQQGNKNFSLIVDSISGKYHPLTTS